jgi:hypothetical protein
MVRKVVRPLNSGESVRGEIYLDRGKSSLAERLLGKSDSIKSMSVYVTYPEKCFGNVDLDGVTIRCVPRNDKFVREFFPDLPALSWEPGTGAIILSE